jgi:hypothetical protein
MSYYLPGGGGLVSPSLPLDGHTGQVLGKSSDLDFDVEWITLPRGNGTPGSIAPVVFTQPTPAAVWNINHNLGHRPIIALRDSGSREIDGEVSHPSDNQTIVRLNPPAAGAASLL